MIKACIFDMDGTTVDSVNSIAYFLNKTLAEFGYCEIPVERYNYLAGNGARTLVERALKEVDGNLAQTDTILKKYSAAYDAEPCCKACVYDGILDMLNELKNRGIKLAIVSNKPDSTVQKINSQLFGELMNECVGAKQGVALKPDPQSLFDTINKLEVEKSEVLYIGDTDVDMITAKMLA